MDDSSDAEFDMLLSNAKSAVGSRKKARPLFYSVQPNHESKAFYGEVVHGGKDKIHDSDCEMLTPLPPAVSKVPSPKSLKTARPKTPKLRLAFLSTGSEDSDCSVIEDFSNVCLEDKENSSPFKDNALPCYTPLNYSKKKTTKFKPRNYESCNTSEISLVLVLDNRDKVNSFLDALSHPEKIDSSMQDTLRMYTLYYHVNSKKLSEEMFYLFNKYVFDNKLPSDMELNWNSRMTSAAGYCHYKRLPNGNKNCAIMLSTKLLISAEKLRDTLIHELCHAATFLISNEKDSHGPFWRCWTRVANITFPSLPLITRCHNYKSTKRAKSPVKI